MIPGTLSVGNQSGLLEGWTPPRLVGGACLSGFTANYAVTYFTSCRCTWWLEMRCLGLNAGYVCIRFGDAPLLMARCA